MAERCPEQTGGYHCELPDGHEGQHEYREGDLVVTWRQFPAGEGPWAERDRYKAQLDSLRSAIDGYTAKLEADSEDPAEEGWLLDASVAQVLRSILDSGAERSEG
jgi:hypothetical protein